MAKKTTKKKTTKKTAKTGAAKKTAGKAAGTKASGGGRSRQTYKAGDAKGKDLVIVESPSKAKTINKYLGSEYVVLASIGHVRDLPSKNPKGVKAPVPGVDIEKRFTPSYEILKGKEQVIKDLKRAAKDSLSTGGTVWFATDLDREGEAIAWHLAQEIGIDSDQAKRVIFPAITKTEIGKAFSNPHPIDDDRVNAQQARRILDRIVGYQVSPLLWKKVARGLSAGRVQSVAVRLIVEREKEIRSFVPDESWQINGVFSLDETQAADLGPQWHELLAKRDDKGNAPTIKSQNAWLGSHECIRAELVEIDGSKFSITVEAGPTVAPVDRANPDEHHDPFEDPKSHDVTPKVSSIAEACGLTGIEIETTANEKGKGPSRWARTVVGTVDPAMKYKVESVETKRTKSRPSPPFITSTLQQAASSRLGFAAQRTMRAAQALYEGITIPGEGPTGLITYMRTDSTFVTPEALHAARDHVTRTYGDTYLPDAPIFYKSSNKSAQEAHEAVRPTDASRTPDSVKGSLTPDQHKLYDLIWRRFVSCQMVPAEWDATTVHLRGGVNEAALFRASGRTLAFDGFYKVWGVPGSGDELNLPRMEEEQPVFPLAFNPQQKFTAYPSRYSEASLIKVLESEGIGRPSTYAAIIQTIQDRKYVEQIGRAFYATDLGEVVTEKLIEGFPRLMDVGYTREMELKLDQIEENHLNWIDMLSEFYGRFTEALAKAEEGMTHAKAEIRPAPAEYKCEKCGSSLVYRFGKNGRFLSCSTYPDCAYACPCDREGRPMAAEFVDVRCPETGRNMIRRTGRFGPFVATHQLEGEARDFGMILNIDKKGFVVAPSPPPLTTDLECDKDGGMLNLRNGARGPWLGCSNFPKCRGRGKWAEIEPEKKAKLEKALEEHLKDHPIPIIHRLDGTPLTDANGKPLPTAPKVDELVLDHDPTKAAKPAGV